MVDVAWWATVTGGLAAGGTFTALVWAFWTDHGRRWFKRQFDIDDIKQSNNELRSAVDRNTERLEALHDDHGDLKILAHDAYTEFNALSSILCEEHDIPDDECPHLDEDRARERLFGNRSIPGDYSGSDD